MQISGFRGELIAADHADYDTTRAVWNGAVIRPVSRCQTPQNSCGSGRP